MNLKGVIFILILFPRCLLPAQGFDPYTCSCKGSLLKGKVKRVESYPDFRIRVVAQGEDLAVDTSDTYPEKCGEWKFVRDRPDFTVTYVSSGEDFRVRFVSYDPGARMNNQSGFDRKINPPLCTFRGIPLHGKVKVVTSFPDLKVQVVESFPDLSVKVVESFPDHCGEWKFVEDFPDFTVQFVTSFPDIRIKYVDSFPGISK